MLKPEVTPVFADPTKVNATETSSGPSTHTSSAPVLQDQHNGDVYLEEKSPLVVLEATPGVLPDEVYDSALTWWRAGIRRLLVRNLKTESRWLAAMQTRVRTDWLDTYFVYSSALGTHTFFLMFLPAIFFFGHDKTGQGLVTVLGMGVYWSSFVKDLVCSPRPFAPPVTRLTIGSHHLEYGFPSTHSTNSTSIALYIHTLIYRMYLSESISSTTLYALQAAIAWYTFSVVYGRLYCAMHSFTDCAVGAGIGAAVWATHWACEDYIAIWLSTSGWSVPVTLISLGAAYLLVPKYVMHSPVIKDSIAFVSSIMGVMLGKWHANHFGLIRGNDFFTSRNPGFDGNDWHRQTVWLGFAGLRLFVGVLSIFVWRLVAKAVFHAILPPIFRFAANLFTLPNRRFYTPATDYERVPAETGLHPIPSVIDLHSPVMTQTSASLPRVGARGLKLRNGNACDSVRTPGQELSQGRGGIKVVIESTGNDMLLEHEAGRKHYDADVLTKVMVYTGIGVIASEGGPVLFRALGWGG